MIVSPFLVSVTDVKCGTFQCTKTTVGKASSHPSSTPIRTNMAAGQTINIVLTLEYTMMTCNTILLANFYKTQYRRNRFPTLFHK
jgi:hypothetical protein